MQDFKRIGDAGWQDPSVGAINWYGILGEETATIHGKKVKQVKPVLQKDGSGFYVSPSSLVDPNVTHLADQSRSSIRCAFLPQSFLAVCEGLPSALSAWQSIGVSTLPCHS
jgi:hypothetical protein